MKKKSLAFFIFFCWFYTTTHAFTLSLYFTPDSTTDQMIIRFVKQAQKSVYIASYTFSSDMLTDILNQMKGIDIKIIVDTRPPVNLQKAQIKVDAKSSLFHPKIIIIDGRYSAISSGNFTESAFFLQHNHFLLFEDEKIARYLTDKFNSWWEDIPLDTEYSYDNIRFSFSPENNCEQIISEAISTARKTIHFAMYHFTSEEIAKVMLKRKLAGVKVYGIIENSSVEPYSVFYGLKNFGCNIRRSNRAGYLHDKLIIVDQETIITGSYNLTAAARRNNEVVIIIKDKNLASKFIKEWKKMWYFYSLPY